MEHNFTNQVNASNANGGLKKINLSQSLKRPHFCLFLFTLIHLLDKSCLTSSNQQWQEKLPCKRRKPGAGLWPADGRLASLIWIWQHLYEERHFWCRLNLEWSGLQMRTAEFGAERAANRISSSVLIRLDVGCCSLCVFFFFGLWSTVAQKGHPARPLWRLEHNFGCSCSASCCSHTLHQLKV